MPCSSRSACAVWASRGGGGGGAGQGVEDPALGVRGVGVVVRAQAALQIEPGSWVDEVGAVDEKGSAARVVDGGTVVVEVVGQEDEGVQDVGAVAAAGEVGQERGHVVAGDGGAGQPGRGLDGGGVAGEQAGDGQEFIGALGQGPTAGVAGSQAQGPLRPKGGRQHAGPGVVVGRGPGGVDGCAVAQAGHRHDLRFAAAAQGRLENRRERAADRDDTGRVEDTARGGHPVGQPPRRPGSCRDVRGTQDPKGRSDRHGGGRGVVGRVVTVHVTAPGVRITLRTRRQRVRPVALKAFEDLAWSHRAEVNGRRMVEDEGSQALHVPQRGPQRHPARPVQRPANRPVGSREGVVDQVLGLLQDSAGRERGNRGVGQGVVAASWAGAAARGRARAPARKGHLPAGVGAQAGNALAGRAAVGEQEVVAGACEGPAQAPRHLPASAAVRQAGGTEP